MLKVLICDDEPNVCQLINKLIDWEALEMVNVGMVDNGIDAYNYINEKRPHIVISDVRMPGYDGIELIKLVHKENIETKFIIISGHKQFEYAHAALKYGVEDYLLKPIKKNEINDILQQIKEEYELSEKIKSGQVQLYEQIEENSEILKEYFFDHLINSTVDSNEFEYENLNQINKKYNLNFIEGVFKVFIIQLDKTSDSEDRVKDRHVISKLRERVLGYLDAFPCENIVTFKENRIMAVLNYAFDQMENIRHELHNILDDAMNFIAVYDCYLITIGVGKKETDYKKIKEAVKTAENVIYSRMFLGTNRMIYYEDVSSVKRDAKEFFNPELKQQLINIMESLDSDSMKRYLKNTISDFINNEIINPQELLILCDLILNTILDAANSNKLVEIDSKKITEAFHSEVQKAYHYKMLILFISNITDEYFIKCNEIKSNQEDLPIRTAKAYIEDHFSEFISLEDIAEQVHLNSVYFSYLFKKKQGINFSEYLINYRIEKAKKMLKETSDNISVIAGQVGYKDSKHFSKLFKKIVGLRPIEYRKLYS